MFSQLRALAFSRILFSSSSVALVAASVSGCTIQQEYSGSDKLNLPKEIIDGTAAFTAARESAIARDYIQIGLLVALLGVVVAIGLLLIFRKKSSHAVSQKRSEPVSMGEQSDESLEPVSDLLPRPNRKIYWVLGIVAIFISGLIGFGIANDNFSQKPATLDSITCLKVRGESVSILKDWDGNNSTMVGRSYKFENHCSKPISQIIGQEMLNGPDGQQIFTSDFESNFILNSGEVSAYGKGSFLFTSKDKEKAELDSLVPQETYFVLNVKLIVFDDSSVIAANPGKTP